MRQSAIIAVLLVSTVVSHAQGTESDVDYAAVFLAGKKVGYAVSSREIRDDQVVTSEKMHLSITRLGMPLEFDVSESFIEGADGRPIAFRLDQTLSKFKSRVSGRVNEEGRLEIEKKSIGPVQRSTVAWPQGALMAEGVRLLQMKKGLTEGSRYTVQVFDASVMGAINVDIRIGSKKQVDLLGRLVDLTEVHSTYAVPGAGAVDSVSYVDEQGSALKSTTPIFGMELELVSCTRAFAESDFDTTELMDKMILVSPLALDRINELMAITYQCTPTTKQAVLSIPSSMNQTATRHADGSATVIVRPRAAQSGQTFPYTGSDPEALAALTSNIYLQCDDTRVIELARTAIGDATDALLAARKIESYVSKFIQEKDLSVGYASALETIESRQGDCTEHALLCAALCRAVGIPARVVIGVVYVDQFGTLSHCFGGHAWTRVLIKDQWLDLDAAFIGTGRGGYGPGHLALAVGNGEPGDFFSLANLLGQFKFEKVIPLKK